MAEQGLKDYETNSWNALLVPKGTPAAVTKRLNTEVNAVLHAPATEERLTAQGFIPQAGSAQDLSRYLGAEYRRYGTLVKKLGIKEE